MYDHSFKKDSFKKIKKGLSSICEDKSESFLMIFMSPINYAVSKFNVDCKNAIKNSKTVFGFSDNCIWIDNGIFSLLLREYS